MTKRRVVVTGMGALSPYGVGIDVLWNLLIVILTNSIGALLVRCLVHLAAIIKNDKKEQE